MLATAAPGTQPVEAQADRLVWSAIPGMPREVWLFERNRFEEHPDLAGTPYEVLLGLIGTEYLHAKGW